jgi:hypothetical protein
MQALNRTVPYFSPDFKSRDKSRDLASRATAFHHLFE